jgi:hypothetical protein
LVFLHVTGRGSHNDPGLLADVVIKATSLQEKANPRLREKSSPYRINEITITAGIPPDVAFTIGRIEVEEEASSLTSLSNAEIELEPVESTWLPMGPSRHWKTSTRRAQRARGVRP